LHPWQRLLLLLAVLLHLSLLISWRTGWYHPLTFDSVATHGQRGWDFFALYQAGHNLRTGVSIYQSDNARIEVVAPVYTPYRYLPFAACTLGWLLSALPPLWAFRLWVLLVELALLASAWVCWRLGPTPTRGATAAALWLVFTPYYLELYLGQFTLMQAALALLMLLAAERLDWGARFTLPWAASLLWKQNTALLAPVLARLRQWRPLLLGVGAVLLFSLPYFAWDRPGLAAFLGNLRSGPPAHALGNLGVRQLLYSLSSAALPQAPPVVHLWLQYVWVVGVVLLGLWITWRGKADALLLLCLWLTSFFLLYHDVWEHHYVLLLPVYATLYRRQGGRLLLVLYALTAIWTPYGLIDPQGLAGFDMPMRWTPLAPRWVDVGYHASKALPTLVLWGYLAWRLLRPARGTEA
jgi:hypothetical protein